MGVQGIPTSKPPLQDIQDYFQKKGSLPFRARHNYSLKLQSNPPLSNLCLSSLCRGIGPETEVSRAEWASALLAVGVCRQDGPQGLGGELIRIS